MSKGQGKKELPILKGNTYQTFHRGTFQAFGFRSGEKESEN